MLSVRHHRRRRRVEEGHGFAQFGADFFDLELGFGLADAGELFAAGFVFGDKFFGELPSWMS